MGRRQIIIVFVVFGAVVLWWTQRGFDSANPLASRQVFHREMSSDSGETKSDASKSAEKKFDPKIVTEPIGKLNPTRQPNLDPAGTVSVEPSALGDSLEKIGRPDFKIWDRMSVAKVAQVPSGSKIEGYASGFAVYQDSQNSARLDRFDVRNPIAVYDERNHKAGVITGTVTVVLKEGAAWDAIANDHGLLLIAPFDHLRMYKATSSRSPFDLEALVTVLKADTTRVESVKVEILDRSYRKN